MRGARVGEHVPAAPPALGRLSGGFQRLQCIGPRSDVVGVGVGGARIYTEPAQGGIASVNDGVHGLDVRQAECDKTIGDELSLN